MTQLIGITGYKGSGKDTAAQALYGYQVVKFADGLKLMLSAYLHHVGVEPATVHRMLEGDMKEVPNQHLRWQTPRHAMQTLGTEWGRNLIGDDIWIYAFKQRAQMFPKVVCTDVRFPNEAQAIHNMGGVIIRVVRGDYRSQDAHPSESYIEQMPVDTVIYNDGTVADLHRKVSEWI